MPRAPRYCPRPGCTQRITTTRYCPEHTPQDWPTGKASRTGTAQHKAWRHDVLERAHWRCQIKGPRCEGKARDADHITPLAQGGAEFDVSNGQAACSTCHREKSLAEATAGRRRAGA